jgi:glycosyltransferase involved in cell wall biosynthesis
MNLGMNIQFILNKKTGVGYYTYNLIKYLQKVDKKNKYKLIIWKLFFKKKVKPIQILNSNFSYKFIRFFPLKIYNFLYKIGLGLPFNLLVHNIDLFIFANFVSYPVLEKKNIIIIYDLSYLKYSQFGEPKNVKFLTKFVPLSIKETDHIVTISKNSKKEIINTYKVPENKISIIYPAIDNNFFKPVNSKNVNLIKKKYNLGSKYLLFMGTLEPRKNIINLIKAYRSLPKKIIHTFNLVLAGGKGWQDKDILNFISKAQNSGYKIIVPGYISEKDLPALYSGAFLFLYPSLYEGFGLPVLEAMSCGCPVIASNTSSIPEVTGNAALLIDPKDHNFIKNAIIELLEDKNLRQDLITKGFRQVQKFSWDKSAKKLINVFNKVYKK